MATASIQKVVGTWAGPARRRLPDLLLILLLGIACVFFFAEPLLGTSCHFPWDIVDQMYPWQRFVSDSLQRGVFPLWNPHGLSGYPIVGDPQSSLFYPPTLMAVLIPIRFPLTLRTVQIVLVLHIILAGVGAYLLGRELALGRIGALVAAIVFMFGGFMPMHVQHETWVKAVAWIPLILFAFHRAVHRDRLTAALGAGVMLGMSLLAGHTQTAVYTVYLLLLYCLYVCLPLIATRRYHRILHRLALLILVVTVGLGVAAVQILPAYELLRHATRGTHDYAEMSMPGIGPLELVTTVLPGVFGTSKSLPPGSPYLGGEPTNHLYLGLPTLALAVLGWKGKNEDKRFFLILAAVSMFLAFGSHFSAYRIYAALVPFFRLFRRPLGFFPFTVLAVAMLSGMGADVIGREESPESVREVAKCFAALGVCFFLLALVMSVLLHFVQVLERHQSIGWLSMITTPLDYVRVAALDSLWVVAVTVVLLTLVVRRQRFGPYVLLGLTGLLFVDLYVANGDQLFNCSSGDPNLVVHEEGAYADRLPAVDLIGGDQLLGQWRVALGPYHGAWDNAGNVIRMESVNGDNPLILRSYAEFWSAIDDLNSPVLDLANVRYVVTNDRFSGLDKAMGFEERQDLFQGSKIALLEGQAGLSNLRLVDSTLHGWYTLYERPTVLPRFFGVDRFVVVAEADRRLEMLQDPSFDPSQLVILERSVDAPLTGYLKTVDLKSYSPNGFSLQAEVEGDGTILVMSEVFYPGWKAYIDGVPTPILSGLSTLT